MSLAEILRRSAKYARRSIEELVRALGEQWPPHAAPSVEPVRARYRNRGGFGPPFTRGRPGMRHFHMCAGARAMRHFFHTNARTRHAHSLCSFMSRNSSIPWLRHLWSTRSGVATVPQLASRAFTVGSARTYRSARMSSRSITLRKIPRAVAPKAASGFAMLKETFAPRYDLPRFPHVVNREIRRRLAELSVFKLRPLPRVSDSVEAASTVAHKPCMDDPTGELSAAVDFTISPRLALPLVSELDETTLRSVGDAISSQIAHLQAVLADIGRISELGELPVSVERNGTVLRVHFPNADVERVTTLVDDKEVTRGRIVEIVPPSSSSSSASDVGSSDELWSEIQYQAPGLSSEASSASDHTPPTLLTLG